MCFLKHVSIAINSQYTDTTGPTSNVLTNEILRQTTNKLQIIKGIIKPPPTQKNPKNSQPHPRAVQNNFIVVFSSERKTTAKITPPPRLVTL